MNSKIKLNLFIRYSSKLGPNVLDWIRSVYFSLFGSSTLTLVLKLSVLNTDSKLIFILGCFLFLIGLLMSVKVADRFKKHERNYDAQDKEKRNKKKASNYYFDEEIELIKFYKNEKKICLFRLEHFLLYTLCIPAFICIGYAGFYMETKSSKNSSESKEMLYKIETKVQKLDSVMQTIDDNIRYRMLFQDSLSLTKNAIYKQEIQIDSLKIVINTLSQNQKNKENKNKK